jgi:multidrug efflux pump subunit AcrA (membrane-fusion protein)
MVLIESAGACRVVENVRAGAPGVMVEINVKVGDMVQKGQILGHIDCDAVKLQLDLARHAMESKANVEAALGQAEAWTVTREETESAVRRRTAAKSRLEWALAMEKMYRSTYQVQVEAKKAQVIQYEYYKEQYDKRFFRAPVDGVVSEVLAEEGKPVTFATHCFTISNENTYAVPVSVPSSLAAAAIPQRTLPVRAADGKSVCSALVESVMNDPRAVGRKVIKLLVHAADFPAITQGDLLGMKFDVLLPQVAGNTYK